MQEYESLSSSYGSEALSQFLSPDPLPDEDCVVEAMPRGKLKARYPASMARAGQPGFVDITFKVSSSGLSRDLMIKGASNEAFIDPTVRAIQRAKWHPKQTAQGESIITNNVEYRFKYAVKGADYRVSVIKSHANELRKEAETGDTMAQFKYGRTLNSLRSFSEEMRGVKLQYKDANEWFLKAAQAGNKYAQYEIGSNIMNGKGCAEDSEKGVKWLLTAASSGHTLAATELAMSPVTKVGEGLGGREYWLRKAIAGGHNVAKLFLAWELSTNRDPRANQPEEAISLLDGISFEKYFDDVRLAETKAAALAANGKFKQAIKSQEEAISQAKILRWDSPIMEKRLVSYKNKKHWAGEYHL